MITGYFGIAYSTNEIKNGRFVDRNLENDFLQTRYDILRQPGRREMVNESIWRANGVEARQHFLRMMEASNEHNQFGWEHDEPDLQGDLFTYDGHGEVPKHITEVLIASDVEEIEDEAFKDCKNLKSIVFNENLRRIGKNAFENCMSLKTLRLVDVEMICDEAFLNCTSLLAVELGSNIQHIGMGAFKNCLALTQVTIPPNTSFIGDYAFANCSSMVTATITDGNTTIPAYCFQDCVKLEQVIIPSSIEQIGQHAFENCVNCEVMIPTMNMDEAEEILGVKMVARAEDDNCLFRCDQGFMVRLYKDLF